MNARIDVTEILTDTDVVTFDLVCIRSSQVVGNDGMANNTPTSIPFSGVVTSYEGSVLERFAEGERIKGSIMVITGFRLQDGRGTNPDGECVAAMSPPVAGATGLTADIVVWNHRQFTVANVNDYSQYGPGFVEARCDLRELSG
jgi:galactose-6-phosphate isomerase